MLLLSRKHFLKLKGHRIEDEQPFIRAGVRELVLGKKLYMGWKMKR